MSTVNKTKAVYGLPRTASVVSALNGCRGLRGWLLVVAVEAFGVDCFHGGDPAALSIGE